MGVLLLVQQRRNAKAAKRFFKKLVKQYGEPRIVVTDKLRSYIKPVKTLALDADHRAHKSLNNSIIRPRRYKLSSHSYRHAKSDAFALWADYTAEIAA